MLNIQAHFKELLDICIDTIALCDGKIVRCYDVADCGKCEFHTHQIGGHSCTDKCREWLMSEYVDIDWDNLPIDTPLMVWNDFEPASAKCRIGYFAGYEDGDIYVWSLGRTSLTVNDKSRDRVSYNNALLYKKGDK